MQFLVNATVTLEKRPGNRVVRKVPTFIIDNTVYEFSPDQEAAHQAAADIIGALSNNGEPFAEISVSVVQI